jgi:stress-induced morphogen
MIEPTEIRARLIAAFPGADVSVKDSTGSKDHYEVRIVSPAFAGKNAVQRHRAVYALFSDVLGGPLHALSLETRTPDEI